jgi:hypothetical protein
VDAKNRKPGIYVELWPDGNRRRSSWWILEWRTGQGWTPLAGPYKSRDVAEIRAEAIREERPAEHAHKWRETMDARSISTPRSWIAWPGLAWRTN